MSINQQRVGVPMNRSLNEMIDLARSYCALIESSGPGTGWLRDVADLLPRLHAGVSSLNGHPYLGDVSLSPDLDARFELYSHLRDLLGERDGYWLEFDRLGDLDAMTGSLADDLTDIYCELKHGLRLVDDDPDRALQDWVTGFENHWGQHLLDAQRHLSVLASQGRLE
jgi:hypothetical protein